MNKRLAAAGIIAAALTASAASAAPVGVKNASFEAEKLPDGGYINGYGPTDWSGGLASPTGPLNPLSGTFASIPDGENVLYSATGILGSVYEGINYQEIASSLATNTRYTLTVDVGHALDVDMAATAIEFTDGLGVNGPPNIYASQYLGYNSIATGTFSTFTLTFDSIGALNRPFGIRFRTFYDSAQGSGQRVTYFDNVHLDASPLSAAAVPEPAAWALLIVGFGAIGGSMRRRSLRDAAFAAA